MPTLRTVLIIADSDQDSNRYAQHLQQDGSTAYKILSKQDNALTFSPHSTLSIDGVLLELHSPSSTSRVLHQLKAQMGNDCPPIVVIADEATESAVQAFRNGAADYLIRDHATPDDVCRAMESAIATAELHREQQERQTQTIHTLGQRNQELTQRLAELQTLVDILPVGVAIAANPECTQMQSNAYLRRLLGVESGNNISKSAPAPEQPPYRTFHNGQEIAPENLPMQVAGRLGQEVRDVEFDILLGDGTLRQLLCYATPLRGDQNQIRGVVGAFLDITERHRDAVALKASQQRYRELAEAMPQMIWTADAKGTVTYRNQRWYEYTGMSEMESIGPARADAVHPDERDHALSLWRDAIAAGKPFETECRFRRWDGEYHWFICRAVPTREGHGPITGWIGTITNINDQKQLEAQLLTEIANHQRTEQALRRGAERLRFAQLAANAGHWEWDIQTNSGFWSAEFQVLCGIDPATSLSYETWLANILAADQERVDQEIRAALDSKQREVSVEYRVYHPERGLRWLLNKGDTQFDAAGRPVRMLGVAFDITERKHTEIALRQSQERLELAMKASEMGSWDWDIETGKIQWSTNLEQLFGTAPGSFDGQYESIKALIHPDDLPLVEQAAYRAIYSREDYNIEFRFIKPDGTVRWALGLGRVFYDDAGTPVMMTGVDIDISARKQIEADLRASEERFRHMADHTSMMIWVTNATGYCTYLNQRWYEFTGQTEATALGWGWLEAVHPDDRESSRDAFLRATERQTAFQLEYRLRRQDGEYRWAIDAASPSVGEAGEFKGYVGSVIDIHDRKQAELALQEAHIQLEAALKAGAIYTWRWNIAEDVFTADRNFAHLFGVSPEEAGAGVPLDSVLGGIHPEDRPRVTARIEHAIATGEHYAEEYRVLNAGGEERCVIARGRVEYDANGRAVAFPGALADITERRKAEEALRFSEERYRTLFESMDEAFCVIEMLFDSSGKPIDYRFLETNPAFERQCGLYNVQGKRMRELIPHHEDDWFEIYGNVALTGDPIRFENSAAALQRWYDLYAFRIGQPESRKVAVLFKDITQRKQAEEAMRQSEDRLRITIESAQLGTWDLDPATGILKWDERCKAMFGLSPAAEVDYDVFLAGLHPDDRDRTHQIVLQSFNPESGGEYNIEYRTVGLEDGIERWVAAKGKAFFNPAGEVTRFIGTVLNITEKKQAEAEREQLLQREQAARADAERANRLKDEFLAVLSHELRSPLNPILGWTKLLQLGRLNAAKTAEALATIERNAKLQTELIDDLLDVAKILRGKLSLNKAPVNLAFAVEEALGTVGTSAAAKAVTLQSALPNIGHVFGDAARLQQIVWNLLSNAIKFTPPGGRVDIQLQHAGTEAHIIVRDTGRGISPDFLPHIFESFQQEDASITRKYGGLGLGLAIVRQLVEAHGGTITASSPGEGLGATFTVQLPLLPMEPDLQPVGEYLQQELDLAGIRVLAVDDEPDARELLTELLTQYGADVLTVASASEVLANLESFQPAVLVSDIAMPEVDGYTLIQQVRALPPARGSHIPAIALTAYAREDDYRRAISSGFQRHVTKPLEPERLVQAVLALTHTPLNRPTP